MLVKLVNQKGFSLIELAIVLMIVGLLLGGLLVPLATSVEQKKRQDTENKLEEIKQALIGYAIINGRLPCPDCPDNNLCGVGTKNDGIEDRTGASPNQICETYVGNLPWVDLQVYENDAWNNHFTYQVSQDFTRESNDAACGTATTGISFELCTSGTINIYDAYSADYSVDDPSVAEGVVAIVVSHGSNYLEPDQEDQEVENYGRNPVNPYTNATILSAYSSTDYDNPSDTYIYRNYSQADGVVTFDDVMVWISPNLLMNKMVSAGRLP